MAYHICFVDEWDDEAQEPVGGGHCGPLVETAQEIPDAVRYMNRLALCGGWGPGEVVVLDDNFNRVPEPKEHRYKGGKRH